MKPKLSEFEKARLLNEGAAHLRRAIKLLDEISHRLKQKHGGRAAA